MDRDGSLPLPAAQEGAIALPKIGATLSGRLLIGWDIPVAQWVASKTGETSYGESFRAIGIMKDDLSCMIAGVVFFGHNGREIFQSTASISPVWARPDVLNALLSYPFDQLGCTRLSGLVSGSNARSISLTKSLGFKLEGTMREATKDGDDRLIFGMLRTECKWIQDGR